jgi:hypothetical protein
MRFFIFAICVLSLSCKTTQTKTMKVESDSIGFKIFAPSHWKHISMKGIDSFIGNIYIGKRDTLHFDFGIYSNSLDYPLFKHKRQIDERFLKQNEYNEIVNNLKVKVVSHKYFGKKDIGYHFDSLWVVDSWDVMKFTIYGSNISKKGQKQMKETLKTITFFKKS